MGREKGLAFPLFPSKIRWAIVFFISFSIFYFSVIEPPMSGIGTSFLALDKLIHLFAYSLLGVSLAYAFFDYSWSIGRKILIVLTATALFGLLIEFLQMFVPGRFFEVMDGVVNLLGACVSLSWFIFEEYLYFVEPGSFNLKDFLFF